MKGKYRRKNSAQKCVSHLYIDINFTQRFFVGKISQRVGCYLKTILYLHFFGQVYLHIFKLVFFLLIIEVVYIL